MKKLQGLTPKEVENISRQIADAFYDYKYNEADQGLIKYTVATGADSCDYWYVPDKSKTAREYKGVIV